MRNILSSAAIGLLGIGCSGEGSGGAPSDASSAQGSTGGASVITGSGGSGGGSADAEGNGGSAGGDRGDEPLPGDGAGDVGTKETSAVVDADGAPRDAVAENAPSSTCPGQATLCEDFESYGDGATQLAPKWEVYTFSATLKVDSTKPHAGTRALHVNTPSGASHFADIIKQTQDGTAVVPRIHFGRVMIWAATIPDGPNGSHWGVTHASGPTADNRMAALKYSHGGQFGLLFAGYSRRDMRPLNPDGTFALRGGGSQPGDPEPLIDCAKRSKADVLPLRKWVCWEWKLDAENNETHLWVDGNPIADLNVLGRGDTCVGMTNATVWQGPVLFNKFILGFDTYQAAPAEEMWFDDLAIGPERIGCAP